MALTRPQKYVLGLLRIECHLKMDRLHAITKEKRRALLQDHKMRERKLSNM